MVHSTGIGPKHRRHDPHPLASIRVACQNLTVLRMISSVETMRSRLLAGLAGLWIVLLGASAAGADSLSTRPLAPGTEPVHTTATPPARARGIHPAWSWRREVPLLASGWGSEALGDRLAIDVRPVPASGLDPDDIALSWDRRAIGAAQPRAASASDRTRDAALAMPWVLSVASAPPGHRLKAPATRALLLLESEMITDGLVTLLKRGIGRPRPYAYLNENARPSDSRYDASAEEAFVSLPSGHAADAWRAASFAITDHVLTRPQAHWGEHAAVGFTGGLLAGCTAALRVEAGVHFPSDAVAGSAIGILGGAGVPLLHRYLVDEGRAPSPPRRAWLAAIAGTVAGIGAAMWIAPAIASP
jgi:membrane-associated phospholipid phosphatase